MKVGTKELFEKHYKAHQEFTFKCTKCPAEMNNRTKYMNHQKNHNHKEDERKKCTKNCNKIIN